MEDPGRSLAQTFPMSQMGFALEEKGVAEGTQQLRHGHSFCSGVSGEQIAESLAIHKIIHLCC